MKDNIDSISVTQIKKVEAFEGTIDEVYGYGIITYDYKAGTINYKIDSEEEKYDCTESYPSPLPTVITDSDSIDELLSWEGNENDLINTTCPQSFYEDNDDEEEDDNGLNGNRKGVINYTITDDNNKNHYISQTTTFISSK